MTSKYYLFTCLSLCLLLSACSDIKSPEVKQIKNATLTGLNTKTLDFDIQLEIFNPNNDALQVKNLEMTAEIEGVTIDAVNQKYDTKMLGHSTFLLPVNIALNLKELAKKDNTDVMSKGLRIYNTGAVDLTFNGTLIVSDGVSDQEVDISLSDNVIFSKRIQ